MAATAPVTQYAGAKKKKASGKLSKLFYKKVNRSTLLDEGNGS
jgi:hypothetical protein